MSSTSSGLRCLAEVIRVLDNHGIPYWVGRGRFRHFTLEKEFGCEECDTDLHIRRGDEPRLRALLPDLAPGYRVTSGVQGAHKLSLKKGDTELEFVYLDPVPGKPERVFHTTLMPARKRFECDAGVFAEDTVEMSGVRVHVPREEYLPQVYGPNWRANKKGDGGVEF